MIELRNISKSYLMGEVTVRALQDVSFSIQRGEFVSIIGASGSGKSTLLHILGCLDRHDEGDYLLDGTNLSTLDENARALLRNRCFGFVFQQFHLLPHLTALRNVELPLVYAGRRGDRACAREKLGEVGLGRRGSHRPREMSGGERQRVAIARALVNNPSVIIADEPTGNLDSKTSAGIIGLLQDLNRTGKTVIMVTHEQDVAKYAGRIITIRDGKVISDRANREDTRDNSYTLPERVPGDRIDSACREGGRAVITDQLRQSLHAIVSHKLRTALSMLGILIGVGSVIAMMSLGQGAKQAMEARLRTLGSNLLSIRGGSAKVRGVATESGSVTRFTFADIKALRDLAPHISRVSGYVRGGVRAAYLNNNWSTSVEGVGYAYGEMRATIPEYGRWFIPAEIRQRAKVAVLGTTVVDELFGDTNPVGKYVKINRINFRVIGIAPEKGFGGFRDHDDQIYLPVTTAMYRVLGKEYLDGMYAEVADAASMEEVQELIRHTIIRRHRLKIDDDDSFYIRDMSEIQEMLSSATATMSLLLGAIAAISLLVGGIGIMNIMLVSVTERTREIGLRKAIGARRSDIMSQFLIEAVMLTFCGGIAGIAVGVSASYAMAAGAGWATAVTGLSMILATGFSIAVGLLFGLWPARHAARLDPIEALRYE